MWFLWSLWMDGDPRPPPPAISSYRDPLNEANKEGVARGDTGMAELAHSGVEGPRYASSLTAYYLETISAIFVFVQSAFERL